MTTPTSSLPHPAAAPAPRDVADVRDVVREAVAEGAPLRLAGAGTWLDAGRPVRADARPLSLAALSGIVEYVPGDLTLTARAGTPLAEIARLAAGHRQWLALDPFGDARGTLGAAVATASAGPLAHAFGGARDNVLGLEAVTGAGDVVRGGGRVVKNVAGFDLVRLHTGAWGTLGALTEVTVRLRALPETEESVVLELPEAPALVRQLLATLRRAALAPWALELLDAALAERLGLGARPMAALRLGGNAELVAAQHRVLSTIGATECVPTELWAQLRAVEPAHAAVVRFSDWPAAAADTWARALGVAARAGGGMVHATPARGVTRVIVPLGGAVPDERALDALRGALGGPFAGRWVAERLPAPLWPELAPGRVADRLSRGIRAAFDPRLLLNPGILGAGS